MLSYIRTCIFTNPIVTIINSVRFYSLYWYIIKVLYIANNITKHSEIIHLKPSIKRRHELASLSVHLVVIPSHSFTAMSPRLTGHKKGIEPPEGDSSEYCSNGLIKSEKCGGNLCYNPYTQECQPRKSLFLSLKTITSQFYVC